MELLPWALVMAINLDGFKEGLDKFLEGKWGINN